jgi:glycerol kinase
VTGTDLVLAIDQGTSSTKALVVDSTGSVISSAGVPLRSAYPRPGWVEQSPTDIVDGVRAAVVAAMADIDPARIAAAGLSTQRESLVLWETASGKPVGPLISWQDQRATEVCDELIAGGAGELVRSRSGLPLDPMFSATKARWLLDAHDPDRRRSRGGEIRLGTVDSWLLSQFAGEHLIEVGNASRTQLLSIIDAQWDDELLDLFGVPRQVLGRVVASAGPFPGVRSLAPLLDGTPIAAVLGDSHAALFAHAGWAPGVVKATYGTGSSVMALCPPGVSSGRTSPAGSGLCLTVAWDIGDGPIRAVEGNIRSSGATLSWLARLVGSTPAELAALAADASSDGVHLVPGFSGLGAPWWDRGAAGLLTGLSFGTELPQVARAALESIAFQVADVVEEIDGRVAPVTTLLADGGASANDVLMQLQADVSGRTVARAEQSDLSPLGAAHLAGRTVGLWDDSSLSRLPRDRTFFLPSAPVSDRADRVTAWHTAVARARWSAAPPTKDG